MSLFHPELVRGGAQTVAHDLFNGLQAHESIEPTLLCSVDQTYPALFKSGACVTGFDNNKDQHIFLAQEYDYWWHKSGSNRSIEAFAEFLRLLRPDIIHFHHFFLFGIDLISFAKKILPEVRIVFTFHEFMVICNANGHMMRTFDHTLCERATPVRCHQCFPDRSPEDFHTKKLWFQSHLKGVDVFTCPSKFMLPIFARWGIEENRLRHVSNGTSLANAKKLPPASAERNRFSFFGQYLDAKGLTLLLDAVDHLRAEEFTSFSIELNGSNIKLATPELQNRFAQFMETESLRPVSERIVVNNGSYGPTDLERRMQRVDWVIVPSVWWEIFCLVISEAWAFGRPVICSDVGGPKERVKDGVDGLFFAMGDSRDLANKIKYCCSNPALWDQLHGGIADQLQTEDMTDRYVEIYDSLKPALERV